MWGISSPDVLQNWGITNDTQHLLCSRDDVNIFRLLITQKLTYIFKQLL